MGPSCARLANCRVNVIPSEQPARIYENVKRPLLHVYALCGLLLLPAWAQAGKKAPHVKSEPIADGSQEQRRSGPTRVAVLELASLGLPEEMRRNLQILLNNSIRTMDNIQPIGTLDVQMMLQGPKYAELNKCGGGPECAARIGRAVGADVVVFGTLASIGDNFSLNLRAIVAANGQEQGRQKVEVSGSRDVLIPAIRLAAFRLLAPEQVHGALMVDTNVDGVVISIDGKRAGTTPLTRPIERLHEGEHVVVVTRDGYTAQTEKLTIRPFETTRLRLQLRSAGGAR